MTADKLCELGRPAGDATLRAQLTDFTALYKFIIDTLVKRNCAEDRARQRFKHSYLQLTPDITRGVEVSLVMPGNRKVVHKSPTFQNANDMTESVTLAIIMIMKVRRDPFFLWLVVLFSGGARALAEQSAATTALAATKGKVRNRGRESASSAPPRSEAGAGAPPGRAGVPAFVTEAGFDPIADGDDGAVGDVAGGDTQAPARTSGALVGAADDAGVEGCVAPNAQSAAPQYVCDDVVERFRACVMLSNGKAVAVGELHPQFTEFHGAPIPLSVVAGFLRSVVPGCEDVEYPFGEDERLCLEKGFPAEQPVLLKGFGHFYKIAWPVASIGYVGFFQRARVLRRILLLVGDQILV